MNLSKTNIISIRIIALFTVAIFMSFIPDYFHGFFGDNYCSIRTYHAGNSFYIEDHYHWGYRHWLFVSMGVVLAFIQLMSILNYAEESKY